MSQDWKRSIDERLARQEAERKQQKADEEKRKSDAKHRAYERQLADHIRRFKCQICGTPSEGPRTWWDTEDHPELHYEWNKPLNIFCCSRCNKWTCGDHIHQGICRNCASKIRY